MKRNTILKNAIVVTLMMTTAFAGCLGDSDEEVDDSNVIRLAFTV